jgi:hypothetical protein
VNRPLLEAMAPSLTRAVCAAHLGLTRPLVARLNLLDDLQPKVKSVGTKSSRLAWIRAVAYAGIFVVLAQMLVRAAEGNLERRRDGFSVFEDTGEGNAVETVLPPADPAPWAHGLSAIGALLPVEIGLDQVETLNLETRVSRDRGYDPELAALLDPGPGPQSSSSLALRLEGSAKTRRVLGDLLVALREAPEVSDAYLEWTLRPQEGGKPYMRFSMVATLAEPSKPGESVP